MIARIWRGWAKPENAEAYRRTVLEQVIPAIEAMSIPGFQHIDVLRTANEGSHDEVEFTTIMWFDHLESVRAFVGEDVGVSHVPAVARAVLERYDERARHHEVLDRRPQHRATDAIGSPLEARAPVNLPDRTCLVLIDVQKGFDDGSWGSRNNPGAEANVARLLEVWRRAGKPVIHVHHASRSPAGSFRPGTTGHLPKPEAAPQAGESVHLKQVNSGFIGTGLEAELRTLDIQAVVVVGLTTNHCVSTTTRMAGNLGFDTYVVDDATATFARPHVDGTPRSAEDVHRAALSDLNGEFATVVDTRTLIRAIESTVSPDR